MTRTLASDDPDALGLRARDLYDAAVLGAVLWIGGQPWRVSRVLSIGSRWRADLKLDEPARCRGGT